MGKRKILITGGTGSLGLALLKRFTARQHRCTVLSRDEVKQGEARSKFPDVKFALGDVRDYEWLQMVMRGHDTVIHAAAYKQVPAAEVNAGEAIETNVIGSRNVARAAVSVGVKRVVGISTDKACAPINCYGQTKALMEKLFQEACLWGDTNFNLVRYGNVLGSRGSVVPLFQKQLKDGVVTLTDPRMTRFWLTLSQAVDLVERAMTYPREIGIILVPNAGASTMEDLLEAVVRHRVWPIGHDRELWDKNPNIEYIGIRPGEKMHEAMVHPGESAHTFRIPGGFCIHPAYSGIQGNLPEGFEYTSKDAPQISVSELVGMLND